MKLVRRLTMCVLNKLVAFLGIKIKLRNDNLGEVVFIANINNDIFRSVPETVDHAVHLLLQGDFVHLDAF